jgi:hypothetical protein
MHPASSIAPNTVLYFPSIEFRSVEWLKLALLLWDKIYRIVPPSYTPRDSYEVRVAADAGLVVNLHPSEEDMANTAGEYDDFLKTLQYPPAGLYPGSLPIDRLHPEKIDDRLYPLLERLAVGVDAEGFLNLPKEVARGYMLFLAESIASRKRIATASDLRDAWTIAPYFRERGNFFDEADEMANREAEGCLSALIFRDIIPSSLAPVTMREVADFVLTRSDERRQIREKINDVAVALSASENKAEADAISRRFTAEIEAAKQSFKKSSGFLSKHEVFALLTVGIPTFSAVYDVTRDYPVGGMLKFGGAMLLAGVAAYKVFKDRVACVQKQSSWSYLIDIDETLIGSNRVPRYEAIFDEFIND